MNTFQIDDMTCGHCAGTIRGALAAVDPQAQVSIDLDTRRVGVESALASAAQLATAIQQAGYTPVPVNRTSSPGVASKGGRCCCG